MGKQRETHLRQHSQGIKVVLFSHINLELKVLCLLAWFNYFVLLHSHCSSASQESVIFPEQWHLGGCNVLINLQQAFSKWVRDHTFILCVLPPPPNHCSMEWMLLKTLNSNSSVLKATVPRKPSYKSVSLKYISQNL